MKSWTGGEVEPLGDKNGKQKTKPKINLLHEIYKQCRLQPFRPCTPPTRDGV